MTQHPMASSFTIGWDVGGWNCDHNGKSRDAIVILEATLRIVGKSWRGNQRSTLNTARGSGAFIAALFALCGVPGAWALGAGEG